MAPDRDQHWTRSKRTSHIKSFSDSERGGHACCTMAGIVRDAKYLRVVLHSMGLTNRKPAPPPCVGGSVKSRKPDADLDTQECRVYRGGVGSLQFLSVHRCEVQFETSACAKVSNRQELRGHHLAGTQSARLVLMKLGTNHDPHEALLRV